MRRAAGLLGPSEGGTATAALALASSCRTQHPAAHLVSRAP